jgi:hypothetical protein
MPPGQIQVDSIMAIRPGEMWSFGHHTGFIHHQVEQARITEYQISVQSTLHYYEQFVPVRYVVFVHGLKTLRINDQHNIFAGINRTCIHEGADKGPPQLPCDNETVDCQIHEEMAWQVRRICHPAGQWHRGLAPCGFEGRNAFWLKTNTKRFEPRARQKGPASEWFLNHLWHGLRLALLFSVQAVHYQDNVRLKSGLTSIPRPSSHIRGSIFLSPSVRFQDGTHFGSYRGRSL